MMSRRSARYFIYFLLVCLFGAQYIGLEHRWNHAVWLHSHGFALETREALNQYVQSDSNQHVPLDVHSCLSVEQATLSYPLWLALSLKIPSLLSFKEQPGFIYKAPDLPYLLSFHTRAPPASA